MKKRTLATVTITLTDQENGGLEINLIADPPMNTQGGRDGLTYAQQVAVKALEFMTLGKEYDMKVEKGTAQ